jgi:hypothetical protein
LNESKNCRRQKKGEETLRGNLLGHLCSHFAPNSQNLEFSLCNTHHHKHQH